MTEETRPDQQTAAVCCAPKLEWQQSGAGHWYSACRQFLIVQHSENNFVASRIRSPHPVEIAVCATIDGAKDACQGAT